MCGGRSTQGTWHPDRQPESASIRSHRGKCQNPRRHRASRSVCCRAVTIGRPSGRSPRDGGRERRARYRPTPCRRPLEPPRTAAGSGAETGRSGPSRTRQGMGRVGTPFHFPGAADPGRKPWTQGRRPPVRQARGPPGCAGRSAGRSIFSLQCYSRQAVTWYEQLFSNGGESQATMAVGDGFRWQGAWSWITSALTGPCRMPIVVNFPGLPPRRPLPGVANIAWHAILAWCARPAKHTGGVGTSRSGSLPESSTNGL